MSERASLDVVLTKRRAALEEALGSLRAIELDVGAAEERLQQTVVRLRVAKEHHEKMEQSVFGQHDTTFAELSRAQEGLAESRRALEVLRGEVNALEAARNDVVDEQRRARERVVEASKAVEAVRGRLEQLDAREEQARQHQRDLDEDDDRLRRWHRNRD